MTFNTDIQKTEKEIAVLQAKLELLKEIETYKSQPRMNFLFDGKFEVISYNKKSYYRFEFPDEVYWYRRTNYDTCLDLKLERITDAETQRLLEGLWFNQVKGGKYKRVEEPKPPVAEAYKVWWGIYPELENDSEYDEIRWQGFQAGYEAGKKGGKYPEPYCPDEPEYYGEIDHDISENVENKTLKEVINRWWMNTFTSRNQWDVDTCIDDLADQIEFWILRNKK